MPLDLHKDCRARLQVGLEESLPKLFVNNNMFVERTSPPFVGLESILPRKVRDLLTDYIDDWPVTEFVLDFLAQELYERDQYKSDARSRLVDIPGYEDVPALASRILDQFASLPWQYRISLPLPKDLSALLLDGEDEIQLGNRARIVRVSQDFASEFTLDHESKARTERLAGTSGNILSIGPAKPKWDSGRLYIQVSATGFIGQHGGSGASIDAERRLKSIFGMAMAGRVFIHQHNYASPEKIYAFVHCKGSDGEWEPITRYPVEDRTSRVLTGLSLHEHDGALNAQDAPPYYRYVFSNISAACWQKRMQNQHF